MGSLPILQIYKGISQCRVVLCCLTPRYAVSASCCKELSLSDLLHKPIIPVMVEKTPWPPPGKCLSIKFREQHCPQQNLTNIPDSYHLENWNILHSLVKGLPLIKLWTPILH